MPAQAKARLQVSSWRTERKALKETERLRALGLPAFFAVTYPKGVTWRGVYIGDYIDAAAAGREGDRLLHRRAIAKYYIVRVLDDPDLPPAPPRRTTSIISEAKPAALEAKQDGQAAAPAGKAADELSRQAALLAARAAQSGNPAQAAREQGLALGMGKANALAEKAVAGLVDNGRARLNFNVDSHGALRGEGEVLLPLYDGPQSGVFTQFGARRLDEAGSKARWVGNIGLGQRFFPLARGGQKAGDLLLGYNAFFDYDLSRTHRRGGLGAELQYDWLRLVSNWYFPFSGWKESKDFAGDMVEERPASGWDARLKAYAPFHRQLALTGSYSRWQGEHVGVFGAGEPERSPHTWSYGLEYTPVPLFSASVSQRLTERGQSVFEAGLSFTWHFGMSFEEQMSYAKVSALRSVSGSRHEFVERENNIVLQYRVRDGRYNIEYLGWDGTGYLFRVSNGLGQPSPRLGAQVTAASAHLLPGPVAVRNYTTDEQGRFWLQLDPAAPANVPVRVRAGDAQGDFNLSKAAVTGLILAVSYNRTAFVTSDFSATATLTATATLNSVPVAINPGDVTWTVLSSNVSGLSLWNRSPAAMNGLNWGGTPVNVTAAEPQRLDMSGNGGTAPTGAVAELTDIVGSRTVTVQASMNIGGTTYTEQRVLNFGPGPLAGMPGVYIAPGGYINWQDAATACGGVGNTAVAGYQPATKLLSKEQLMSLVPDTGWAGGVGIVGHGLAYVADIDSVFSTYFRVWAGEVSSAGYSAIAVDTLGYLPTVLAGGPYGAFCLP
ncbi:MAG: inverse autotransporter beta domain-containing protein [Deltaproteobacteria bacterium]|jgi:hypothetical protein|nr:inverse autotransporter beta domain-containing protein [Deltaproteobacteria bacterium]